MKEKKDLYNELFILLYEKFKLKVQIKNKKINETHLLKKIKKDIARIKTLISINKLKEN